MEFSKSQEILNKRTFPSDSSHYTSDSDKSNYINKKNILKHIIINIFSSCFGLLCIFLIETINLIFMGRTPQANLNMDSVGLGNIYLNFIGVLIGFGLLGGLDTMGSHAFGAKRYESLGVYTIRLRIILFGLFFLFTVPLCIFSYNIFTYLNIKIDIAGNAAYYCIYMLPAVFFTFNFNLNIRYLQVMQVYFIPSLIAITATFIHFVLCYIFVNQGYYITGVGITSCITMFYCLLVSTIYILYKNPYPSSLMLYSPDVFIYHEFISYLKMCVYSGIQHYGDYIGYEVVCFMCSYLEESSMAATLIVLNYANIIGYIYVGFSFPLSHMVGIFLGAKNWKMYHYSIKLFTIIHVITALILGSVTFFFSDDISNIYTVDPISMKKSNVIFKYWVIGVG